MPEQYVAITHADIPGNEIAFVTMNAYLSKWQGLGWTVAASEAQPDIVYSIPSTEKGVPYGVATLDADGMVVQQALGPTGGITAAEVDTKIATAIAGVTAASVGAHPVTSPILLATNGVMELPQRASHPTPVAGKTQYYSLTSDGSNWVQIPSGKRTQLAPGLESPTVVLSTAKTLTTTTNQTIITVAVEADAVYEVWISAGYESSVTGTSGAFRNAFTVPSGSTGSWGAIALNSGNTGTSGSATANLVRKKWNETMDMGGRGAGLGNSLLIHGTLYTDTTAGNFVWQGRQSTTDAVPVIIYGEDTADWDGARLSLKRVG